MRKRYLGDSVYAEVLGDAILLTTENGMPTDPSNEIYIESHVYGALEAYIKELKAENIAKAKGGDGT